MGVAIGMDSEETNDWMLALIAGQFLYIALVDLVRVCVCVCVCFRVLVRVCAYTYTHTHACTHTHTHAHTHTHTNLWMKLYCV